MNVYEVDVIVEHHYRVKSAGAGEVEAANNALTWVMDNEDKLNEEEFDGRIEGTPKLCKPKK